MAYNKCPECGETIPQCDICVVEDWIKTCFGITHFCECKACGEEMIIVYEDKKKVGEPPHTALGEG